MSNLESTLATYDQLPVDPGLARELTQMCAELELPYEVATGCGSKAIAIMSFLRLQDIQRSGIGIVMSHIPDLSPDGIRVAEAEHDAMCFKQSPYPFAQRLEIGIGAVDMGARAVEWGGVRFAETELSDGPCIVAERLVAIDVEENHKGPFPDLQNSNKWHMPLPGNVYMCNHIAATLGDEIIDPGYEEDRPLSYEEWRECQEFPEAVLLSSTAAGTAVPFRIHAELMHPEQRRRYDMLLEETGADHKTLDSSPAAYEAVVRGFFNVENASSQDNSPTDTVEQRVSRRRVNMMLEGPAEYDVPQDHESCKAELERRIARLNLAMTYQRWLKETDAIIMGI